MSRLAIACLLCATSVVRADPSVVATVTTEINASADAMGTPSSIAPDLSVRVADDLGVALIHSTFAMTGFRGGAGGGVCVSEACARTYDNVGLEGTLALTTAPITAGLTAGVIVTSIDRGWVAVKIGAKLRHVAGRVTLASAPSVFVATTERDGAPAHRDRLFLPVSAMVLVAPPLSLGASTGFKAPLDDLGGGYEIAAGALAQVALDRAWLAGASWVHGRILGGDMALPDGTSGLDYRAIQIWITHSR